MYRLSASQIREKFVSGEVSATEIASYFLKRIQILDKDLKSFLYVYEKQVLEQAKALDQKRADGKPLGKLAAVPVALKDNMHMRGEITSCASKFLSNYVAPFDATVTKLIREADGLVIGKTNMDEFAMGSSTDHSAFQRTNNPWDLSRVPGGSSGGSSAAVAARLCPLALGSDTGGSIRQPAALTGIVGLKPTYGRISRYGLVAFASSLDQIGPFSTCTADSALICEVLGQPCHHDATHLKQPSPTYNFDKSIAGMKVGVPQAFAQMAKPDVLDSFEKSLKVLEECGAEIVDIELPVLRYGVPTYYVLSTAEASTNLARFDGIRYGIRTEKAHNLEEVYTLSRSEGFGHEVKQRILLGTYVLSSGFKDAYYEKAQKVRTLFIEGFKKTFELCDVIATPTSPSVAFKHDAIHDPLEMYLQDLFTIPANLAGLPAISVPTASCNLPIGIQFTAPPLAEEKLFQCAYAFEQQNRPCIPPAFDKELS